MKPIANIIKNILLLGLILFVFTNLSAQKLSYQGFTIGQQISGSGHGSVIQSNQILSYGRNLLTAGIIYDNKEAKVNGLDLNYKYLLNPECKKTNAYLFGQLVNRWNAQLSAANNHNMHGTDYTLPNERYNTIESYLGIGLQVNLPLNFYVDGKVGFGGYYSKLSSDFDNRITMYRMYREDAFVALSFDISLGFRIL